MIFPAERKCVGLFKRLFRLEVSSTILISDDEDLDDEDVDDEPSLQPFMNLHHIFQDKINNGVNKTAPAA